MIYESELPVPSPNPPSCINRQFAVIHQGMAAYEVKRALKALFPDTHREIGYLLLHGHDAAATEEN